MLYLLDYGIHHTLIAMVDNAPLFRVSYEEYNITQRLCELFCGHFFMIYFPDKEFEPPISRSKSEPITISLSSRLEYCIIEIQSKFYSIKKNSKILISSKIWTSKIFIIFKTQLINQCIAYTIE